jgi:hypothetical protein
MKRIRHFMGWLFGYCPYGHDCPPKHPFKLEDDISHLVAGGGGC